MDEGSAVDDFRETVAVPKHDRATRCRIEKICIYLMKDTVEIHDQQHPPTERDKHVEVFRGAYQEPSLGQRNLDVRCSETDRDKQR